MTSRASCSDRILEPRRGCGETSTSSHPSGPHIPLDSEIRDKQRALRRANLAVQDQDRAEPKECYMNLVGPPRKRVTKGRKRAGYAAKIDKLVDVAKPKDIPQRTDSEGDSVSEEMHQKVKSHRGQHDRKDQHVPRNSTTSKNQEVETHSVSSTEDIVGLGRKLQSGDTVILEPGVYSELPVKAGVKYKSSKGLGSVSIERVTDIVGGIGEVEIQGFMIHSKIASAVNVKNIILKITNCDIKSTWGSKLYRSLVPRTPGAPEGRHRESPTGQRSKELSNKSVCIHSTDSNLTIKDCTIELHSDLPRDHISIGVFVGGKHTISRCKCIVREVSNELATFHFEGKVDAEISKCKFDISVSDQSNCCLIYGGRCGGRLLIRDNQVDVVGLGEGEYTIAHLCNRSDLNVLSISNLVRLPTSTSDANADSTNASGTDANPIKWTHQIAKCGNGCVRSSNDNIWGPMKKGLEIVGQQDSRDTIKIVSEDTKLGDSVRMVSISDKVNKTLNIVLPSVNSSGVIEIINPTSVTHAISASNDKIVLCPGQRLILVPIISIGRWKAYC